VVRAAAGAMFLGVVGLGFALTDAQTPPTPQAPVPTQTRQLVSLTVFPDKVLLSGAGARQQLQITGHFSDGSLQDLTHSANLKVADPILKIQGGVLYGLADGKTNVMVTSAGRQATVPVQVKNAAVTPPLSFRNDVMAVFSKAGCNAGTCHGNFNGKNGFRLSLRGEDPDFDFLSLTHDTHGRRLNVYDPPASLLLQKPTGQLPHEGSVRFGPDSADYATLKRWIAEGAKPDPAATPKLKSLEVTPSDRVLLHGADEQQLVVRASFDDGSVRDVTHLAVYEPSAPMVTVSPTGLVTAQKSGQVTVVVRYLHLQVPSRLAFRPEHAEFTWKDVPAFNFIDPLIFQRLKELQIEPSGLADEATFLRRAFLDVCGILPTMKETQAYLADKSPDKRAKLIDQLLERPEYADFWTQKWADLLRNEEKAVDAKGVKHFQLWIHQAVSDDRPLDQFVHELLTARGSTYENPAANYYRTNLNPQKAAETTAQVFLGVRLACAKCHNHPFDKWKQSDYHGLSAFFARVKTYMVSNNRKDNLDKHELNGEMIVWMDREGEVPDPQTGEPMPPRLPGGQLPKIAPDGDRLKVLADWLTAKDNPYFAKNLANRIWYHLLGRGLVDPVDDVRASNPASHETLLDALAKELVEHNFSQKHLIRTIMMSRTYQLSYRPTATNKDDEINYSHSVPRMLTAEQLLDAICQVTEVPESFPGQPLGTHAAQLPGVAGAPKFLKIFGRPDRLLACECERQTGATLTQAFTMISSAAIHGKIQQSPLIDRLLKQNASNEQIAATFYLAALCRYPSAKELQIADTYLNKTANRREAVEDLLWAVLSTKEFLLRR
jgi:hypothetical protein